MINTVIIKHQFPAAQGAWAVQLVSALWLWLLLKRPQPVLCFALLSLSLLFAMFYSRGELDEQAAESTAASEDSLHNKTAPQGRVSQRTRTAEHVRKRLRKYYLLYY